MSSSHSSESDFLTKLTEIIETNLTNSQFGVSMLARESNMSRSNLHRKVISIANISVSQFINQVRLKKAKELLRHTADSVSDVAYKVGFNNVSYFIKCFHKYYGYSPGQIANREEDESNSNSPGGLNKNRLTTILYSAIFVVVAALALFFVFKHFTSKQHDLEKSIAVLPFVNDSPDEEMHFINGTMEEILDNLRKIKDLRVVSRNSVEQYREHPQPTPIVAEEMNVRYILEGSGQRDGDNIRLTVLLFDARNDHYIWSESYIKEIKDIFKLQSDIAQLVAREIEAIITPEEKQLIEKMPTTDLTAYDFYQRGEEEFRNGEIENAEDCYYRALDYDSTFAQAYVGLARVYKRERDYFPDGFLDSVLILADEALSFDNQLADAYTIRGDFFFRLNKVDQAEKEFDKAIRFNPNDYQAYLGKARVAGARRDYVNRLYYYFKAASLNRGPELPYLLRLIGSAYRLAGFHEESKYYYLEALKLDGDSSVHYSNVIFTERCFENYEKSIEIGLKGYAIDSLNPDILRHLGLSLLYVRQYEESLKYFEKYVELLNTSGDFYVDRAYSIGFVYSQTGYDKEAEYYFGESKKFWEESIRLNHWSEQGHRAYIELSVIYASMGEKQKAIENLKIFSQRKAYHLPRVYQLKNSPIFDCLRDDPEFQQIVLEVEAKYQAEHERIRQWLEENDML